MLKLGLISDSHGHARNLKKAALALADCDWLIHLGDVTGDAGWLAGETRKPMYAVRGNCDTFSLGTPEELTLTIEGYKLLLAHGHRYGVKRSLYRLCLRAQEANAQIALYGHTHIASVERDSGILLVNPGALMDGRCAVLTFGENGPVPVMKIL